MVHSDLSDLYVDCLKICSFLTLSECFFHLHTQLAFVWIFLQELVTGKGVFVGLGEGNWFFLLNAGVFGILVLGLTGWLAIQGDDDYTEA